MEFEKDLLDSGGVMRRAYGYFIENGGKIIAIITLVIASLVTFTDVSLDGYKADNFASTLFMLLISSYLIFFSLEDAGERLGEGAEWYKSAKSAYLLAKERIKPTDIPALRDFCTRYSREELDYRRISLLTTSGYSLDEYEEWNRGAGTFDSRAEKCFSKVRRMQAVTLSPHILLSSERTKYKSELINPEKYKLPWLILQLIPSTLCMTFTVSIILSAKDGLTPSGIIDGILKLSALPIIGFRGYSEGYSYVKNGKCAWIETKTRLLLAFLKERESGETTII